MKYGLTAELLDQALKELAVHVYSGGNGRARVQRAATPHGRSEMGPYSADDDSAGDDADAIHARVLPCLYIISQLEWSEVTAQVCNNCGVSVRSCSPLHYA